MGLLFVLFLALMAGEISEVASDENSVVGDNAPEDKAALKSQFYKLFSPYISNLHNIYKNNCYIFPSI